MKYFVFTLIVFITTMHHKGNAQLTLSASATEGCDTLTATFSQSNIAASTVSWHFGDGNTSNEFSPIHTYRNPGTYSVLVVVNGTDSARRNNYINVHPSPVAGIEYRDTITGSPLIVSLQAMIYNENSISNKPFTYKWTVNTFNATSRTINYTFDTTGIYEAIVVVTDTKGCYDTVRYALDIREKLIIPNVFTPNNDNINDFFIINSNNRYFLNFQLFTRNGLLIYKTKAKTIVWDGKSPSGEDVPEGIYFYIIDAEGSKPHIQQKGFLYIYR